MDATEFRRPYYNIKPSKLPGDIMGFIRALRNHPVH